MRREGSETIRDLGERAEKSLALNVPRQCPLVLLVVVRLRKDKALGSEESKESGSEWTLL